MFASASKFSDSHYKLTNLDVDCINEQSVVFVCPAC